VHALQKRCNLKGGGLRRKGDASACRFVIDPAGHQREKSRSNPLKNSSLSKLIKKKERTAERKGGGGEREEKSGLDRKAFASKTKPPTTVSRLSFSKWGKGVKKERGQNAITGSGFLISKRPKR